MTNRPMTVVLATILLSPIPWAIAQEDPRVTRILAMGTAAQTPIVTYWFVNEPSTDPTVIPTRAWGNVGGSDIMRFIRIYFPRSFENLLGYEFIFLVSPDMSFITPRNQQSLYDALDGFPRAAANTRSIMSGVSIYYEVWRDSILSDAFPNDVDAVIADQDNLQGVRGPLVIDDDPALPPIMSPYKQMAEPLFRDYDGINTVPRGGSVILSYTTNNRGVGSPIPGRIAHVFYWNWSRSITFTFRDRPNDDFWGAPQTGSLRFNPYGVDIMMNVIWWSTGRGLPQDPLKVHEYRRLVYDYGIQRSLLLSLLDFAEIFGADSSGIYAESNVIDERKRSSGNQYLDREFDQAHEMLQQALGNLVELQAQAMKLKDNALLWVYLAEWLATAGTLIISGVALWSLMVRRALYRDIASTTWRA